MMLTITPAEAGPPPLRDIGSGLIPLADLHESASNPRRHFDAGADAELAASIRSVGVLEPLLVRKVGARFEVVAGARRLNAARAAELVEVPCRVLELTDDQVLEVQITENLQRQDVHPLDEAWGFQGLLESERYDVPAIAAKVGKSDSYVYQRLSLTRLTAEAEKAFEGGAINVGHALELARLQPADQKAAVEWLKPRKDWQGREGEVPSVRDLMRWIREEVFLDLHAAPWRKDDEDLMPAAGSCVACPKRTGFAPTLFPDITKKDTCTDRSCFASKRAAFLARQKEKLGAEVVTVSEEWTNRRAESKKAPQDDTRPTLFGKDYRELSGKKDRCEYAEKALVAEGTRVGKTIDICRDSKCPVHGRGRGGRTPSDQAAHKVAMEKVRLEAAIQRKAFDMVLENVEGPLPVEDLRLLAEAFFERLWADTQKKVIDWAGWSTEKGAHRGTNVETARTHIATLTEAGLYEFLFRVALTILGDGVWHGSEKHKTALLGRYDISLAEIRKELLAERKGKGKTGKAKPVADQAEGAPVAAKAKKRKAA